MKTIGLLSDTHGYLDDAVFTHFADCDEIWHAGDVGTIAQADTLAAFKPLRCVYGNIDGQDVRIVHPEHQFFEVEGVKELKKFNKMTYFLHLMIYLKSQAFNF